MGCARYLAIISQLQIILFYSLWCWCQDSANHICALPAGYMFSSANMGHDWEIARLEEKEETCDFLLNLCWFYVDFLFLWVSHLSPLSGCTLGATAPSHSSSWIHYVIFPVLTEPASSHLLPLPPELPVPPFGGLRISTMGHSSKFPTLIIPASSVCPALDVIAASLSC